VNGFSPMVFFFLYVPCMVIFHHELLLQHMGSFFTVTPDDLLLDTKSLYCYLW
jgi:hypothetical protein